MKQPASQTPLHCSLFLDLRLFFVLFIHSRLLPLLATIPAWRKHSPYCTHHLRGLHCFKLAVVRPAGYTTFVTPLQPSRLQQFASRAQPPPTSNNHNAVRADISHIPELFAELACFIILHRTFTRPGQLEHPSLLSIVPPTLRLSIVPPTLRQNGISRLLLAVRPTT